MPREDPYATCRALLAPARVISVALIHRIVTALEEAGGPLRAAALADRLSAPINSIRTTLHAAVSSPANQAARRVERVERGLYGLRQKATDLGLTWHDAVTHVLEEAAEPMHYRDITDEIVSRQLAARIGLTPARTVNATLSANKDDRFVAEERGVYSILEDEEGYGDEDDGEYEDEDEDRMEEEEASRLSVVAFGMYWQRESVRWTTTANLLGVESYSQPASIDFSDQRGLYLLHRGHRTVYVGKAVKQPLGKRIADHTRDRLSGRWDSFSWLGFRELQADDGTLAPMPSNLRVDPGQLISLMEFWLIEAVEPALNRRQGDTLAFDATEYLQREDPELEKARKKELMSEMFDKM